MQRFLVLAVALTVLPPAVAQAQFKDAGEKKNQLQIMEDEKRKAQAAADREYQAAVRKRANEVTPANAVNDPWANVRSGPTPSDRKK